MNKIRPNVTAVVTVTLGELHIEPHYTEARIVEGRLLCGPRRQNHVTVLNLAPHMSRKMKRRSGGCGGRAMGGNGFVDIWGFPYMGVPKNGWVLMEKPI